ncbi:MAG TPA: cell division topological specificity factor MinE [Rudaea sp.]|nr:cell division topological specificity factor MinE [Rudaea sp.]
MGIFDFLKARPKHTATIARERLRIIVAQERAERGSPDYLPLLRRELLEVIRKYVNVNPDAVDVHVERDGEHSVLELSVALPERNDGAGAESRT